MGKVIFFLVVLVANAVYAEEVIQMDPKQHTCSEIQAVLQRDSRVMLKDLLGFYDIYFATRYQCPLLHYANISYVSSKDETFCLVGFTCRLKP